MSLVVSFPLRTPTICLEDFFAAGCFLLGQSVSVFRGCSVFPFRVPLTRLQ